VNLVRRLGGGRFIMAVVTTRSDPGCC